MDEEFEMLINDLSAWYEDNVPYIPTRAKKEMEFIFASLDFVLSLLGDDDEL